jgi:hypothetical protein
MSRRGRLDRLSALIQRGQDFPLTGQRGQCHGVGLAAAQQQDRSLGLAEYW